MYEKEVLGMQVKCCSTNKRYCKLIEEVAIDIGDPNCKLIEPFILKRMYSFSLVNRC